MNDLSEFMRSIKERMTIYYNENNNREGTLWESRFGSTLVEHAPGVQLLKNFAAYIDLNPVRVKIVDDPQHYNWSSCGDPLFEKGLEHLFPEAEEGDRPGLYVQFLRDRARRKGYVKKKAQGESDLFDVLSKNDVMTRSRAIGSPAFIAAVAGHRPPGGLTTFSSAADVPFIAVGQLKRRKNRIS